MLAATQTWPQLRALSYFDAVGNCDWRLDSTAQSLQAFVDAGDDPAAHARPSAYLAPSTRLGVAPLTVRFDASGSTGTGAAGGSGIAAWSLDFGDGSTHASGTGQPPASLAHAYPAGSYTAWLRVTDSTGASNQDQVTVTAAGPPTISGMIADITTTSASVRVWVSPQGYGAGVRAEWGLSTSYGTRSGTVSIPSTTTTAALVFPLASLQPATRYYVEVVATSAAGTTVRPWQFTTPGPPTATTKSATQVSVTAAVLNGRVNPQQLASTYYYEWGSSTAYGHSTAQGTLDPASWDISVPVGVSGLSGSRTYHYRLVAKNASGTVRGADETLTTD
jgi:PKD domain